ncbi:MAG: MFS transporter [Neisseriaceae bacterium]|nr:MFS transporter [Neisseriaceae bacterium]
MFQQPLNVQDLLDQTQISLFQKITFLILFMIAAVDGFDVSLIAYIGPSIAQEWAIQPQALSIVFGASLLGLMTGSILFGPLADKLGTKKILIVSLLIFSLGTLLTAQSHNVTIMAGLRFFTGLGLGGAMPICIALSTEYAPKKRRMMMATLSWSGFTVGIAVGGLVASQIVPSYGWRQLLLIGGIVPLMLLPLILTQLPESLQFMLSHQQYKDKLITVLSRISGHAVPANSRFQSPPTSSQKAGAASLFTQANRLTTLLLWLAFFSSLFTFYLLTYWLPILFSSAFNTQKLSLVAAMLPLGGTVGAITLALLMDARKEPFLMLSLTYFSATLIMLIAGSLLHTGYGLFVFVFFIGFTIAGAQNGLNLIAATIYPPQSKTTGIAWAMACGRFGSIIGSIIGAWFIAFSQHIEGFFHYLALATLVTALAIFGLYLKHGFANHTKPSGKRIEYLD